MLNLLLKTIQSAGVLFVHAWQQRGKYVLVLPLQAFCFAATNLLYCRYKPFVLLLQAGCTVTTSRLYYHYKPFVLPLQAACSALLC